jgi:predicted outer membrane repeat protein
MTTDRTLPAATGSTEEPTGPGRTVTIVTTAADGGPGSLRAAIEAANGSSELTTITFAPGLTGQTIQLTSGAVEIQAIGLVIDGDIDRDGRPDVTVRGQGDHAFEIDEDTDAQLEGLVIQGGLPSGPDPGGAIPDLGGAILNRGTLLLENSIVSDSEAGFGGGIYNEGLLSLVDTRVTGNKAEAGGGIASTGTLSLYRSLVDGNEVIASAERGGFGGGIDATGKLSVTDSTITSNRATLPNGTDQGGAVSVAPSRAGPDSEAVFTNSTIVGNQTPGIVNASVDVTLANTIVADNSVQDVIGGITVSNGANLFTSAVHGAVASDRVVADPMLGPLQDNGGPTPTFAVLAGSPALDAGVVKDAVDQDALPFDQRGEGFWRVSGGSVDLGAFELQHNQAPLAGDDDVATEEDRAVAEGVASGAVLAFEPSGGAGFDELRVGPAAGSSLLFTLQSVELGVDAALPSDAVLL